MDPAEQGDHNAQPDHHSQDRSDPSLHPSPTPRHPPQSQPPQHLHHQTQQHQHSQHSQHSQQPQHSPSQSHPQPQPLSQPQTPSQTQSQSLHQHQHQQNPLHQLHSQPSQPRSQPLQPLHQSLHHSSIPIQQQLQHHQSSSHRPASIQHNPHHQIRHYRHHHQSPTPHHHESQHQQAHHQSHHHHHHQHQPNPDSPSPPLQHAVNLTERPVYQEHSHQQMHMHVQQQQQQMAHRVAIVQQQNHHPRHHQPHQRLSHQRTAHPPMDNRQTFVPGQNVLVGIQAATQQSVLPLPPAGITRSGPSITPGQSSEAESMSQVTQSSSTAKLWEHFIKGDKMQKTNKFFAHCIYCRKVNRDSATRGERRMMSAHLSTCSEATAEARAEGLSISKELKVRRSNTIIGRNKVRGGSVAPGGPVGGVGMSSVGKRLRRSMPSIHAPLNISGASIAASGASSSLKAAAVGTGLTRSSGHEGSAADDGGTSASPGEGGSGDTGGVVDSGVVQSGVGGGGGGSAGGGGDGGDTGGGGQFFDPGMSSSAMGGLTTGDVVRSGHVTTSDHVRLYYEDAGSGHPLILIHGLAGSCKYFESNFADLASSFRVIRFDLRGHGDSEKPQYGFHVHRLAADLRDLLNHFSLERVALLGCSLGCAVIWAFVELFGVSQISAAMFVDQSPYQMASPDGMWRLGSKTVFSEGSLAHVCAELTKNPRAFHERNVRAGFTRPPSTMELTTFVNESLKSEVWFTSKLMANHSYMDWRSVLPLVNCPVLVIAGKKSKAFPWEGVAYAASSMPHAKLIPFEEGSHWLYIEEANRFNNTIEAFLQSIVSGS